MATQLGEDTKITLDLKTIGIVIAGAISLAAMYFTLQKEIEIAKDTLRQEGKPEEMLDKIAKGKIQRYFKDNTLVNQAFIKDSKQSVAGYVKSVDSDLTVVGFERVALGE